MTQNERDLLLKDLCGRLTYGVKVLHEGWNYEWDQELSTIERVTGIDEKFIYTKVLDKNSGEEFTSDRHGISLFDDKPFLFPLSSMTEEQRKEFVATLKYLPAEEIDIWTLDTYDWCNKNHFDYRGLIPKYLAIDATGRNIY